MSREKWSLTQEKRAKILFELHPKLEEAYNLINSLRSVFRNNKLTKEAAKEKLGEWYDKVAACTLREIKSVRDTIKFYEDEILNYVHRTSDKCFSRITELKNQMLPGTSERNQRHTFLHVSFSDSFLG